MVWFFVLGKDRRCCETRLADNDNGYVLIISDSSGEHLESFTDLRKLLSREHELLAAWRAQGWRPTTVRAPA